MVKTYLETKISQALEANDLVENNRTQIFYKPENYGEFYRKSRQFLIKNFPTICIGAVGVAGASIGLTSYYRPDLVTEVATGFGALGAAGLVLRLLGPLDRFLYGNPKDVARRFFMSVDVPWTQAYDSLEITSKGCLDGYVLMAQTPSAVKDEFYHHDSQLTLGVAIARVADYLSELSLSRRDCRISGLTLEDLIEMMIRQKMGTPEETEMIKSLHEHYSTRKLAKCLRKSAKTGRCEVPGLDVLKKYADGVEFALRISEADNVESIGAQLSRGYLVISNASGPHAASYAGMHSKGKDFPRVKVKDDVGHSLMTHAKRGMVVVGGNAQQGVLNEATGGVVIIEGTVEHNFCHRMDDSSWPAIGISVGGLMENLDNGDVLNGVVVSLNKNRLLEHRSPAYYRFINGEKTEIDFSREVNPLRAVADKIGDYITEWVQSRSSAE